MKGKKYQQKSLINSNNKNNKNFDKNNPLHINELKFGVFGVKGCQNFICLDTKCFSNAWNLLKNKVL